MATIFPCKNSLACQQFINEENHILSLKFRCCKMQKIPFLKNSRPKFLCYLFCLPNTIGVPRCAYYQLTTYFWTWPRNEKSTCRFLYNEQCFSKYLPSSNCLLEKHLDQVASQWPPLRLLFHLWHLVKWSNLNIRVAHLRSSSKEKITVQNKNNSCLFRKLLRFIKGHKSTLNITWLGIELKEFVHNSNDTQSH